MRLRMNKDDDGLYFRLNESAIVESGEVRPGVILDFDEDGQVVEVEFSGKKTGCLKKSCHLFNSKLLSFVRGIEERLGIRAKGRKVAREESGFEFKGDFRP